MATDTPSAGSSFGTLDSARGTLAGGSGADMLYAKGVSSLSGGAGRDAFVLQRGNGSVTITDFDALGGETLRLQGYDFKDLSSLLASARVSGPDLLINLGGGETLTLKSVSPAQLSNANLRLDTVLPTEAVSNWQSAAGSGSTLKGTAGNDQLSSLAAAPDVTLAGGKGHDVYYAYDMSTQVVEAADGGRDTVITYSAEGFVLPANVENLILRGDWKATIVGNELDNTLTGNAEDNLVVGGKGNDTLAGGGGSDIFAFAKGDGSDNLIDFQAGKGGDVLRLDDFGLRSFAEVKAAMTQVGADVVLNLGSNQTMTLQNVSLGALTSANVSLPKDSSTLVKTFHDGFNVFDRFGAGHGTWTTTTRGSFDQAFTMAVNDERQIYTDATFAGLTGVAGDQALGLDPFAVSNGQLMITAAPIDISLQTVTKGYNFSSGYMSTESSFTQTYGYFELRAQLPEGKGAWPAFWMLPARHVVGPEIDIMEAFGDKPGEAHHAVISADQAHGDGAWVRPGFDPAAMHSYGVEWTPYTLTFYVDGLATLSVATPIDLNSPMYLIANLAMGGATSWPGQAAADLTAQFTIDSIAAYQLPEYTLANYTLKTSAPATHFITGTLGDDAIAGTDGNDWINGRTGVDALSGGLGDDVYVVNNANTKIAEDFAGGIDTVIASTSFTLSKNVENLTAAKDTLWSALTGNGLANIITGNAGTNIITGGKGNDILTGGGGKDVFVFNRGDGSDIITDFKAGAGTGNVIQLTDFRFNTFDEVKAAMQQVGSDTYIGLDEYDTLVLRHTQIGDFVAANFRLPVIPVESQAPERWLIGAREGQTLYGSAANERFETGAGTAVFYGGKGDDSYLINASNQVLIEYANEGIDSVEAYASYTLSANLENLTLMAGGTGVGNTLSNRIVGSGAADVLNGKSGADTITGGAGSDVFIYEKGSGFDTITDFHGTQAGLAERDSLRLAGYDLGAYLTNAGDVWTVHHSGGTDSFRLEGVTSLKDADFIWTTDLGIGGSDDRSLAAVPGDDVAAGQMIRGNFGTNTLLGSAGADQIYGGGGNDELYGGAGNDMVNGGTGDDRLYGQTGDDTLYGEEGNDILDGGVGNDRLFGQAGHDTLYGGTGNDTLYGGDGADKLYGQDGEDALYGGADDDVLDGGAGDDVLAGEAGNDTLYGGIGSDTHYGGIGNDKLYGQDGNDTLFGEDGDDIVDGGMGDDVLLGQAGHDTLYAGDGNDFLDGGAGNDRLYGGVGSDQIYGGDGNDILDGGTDDDLLAGGAGTDTLFGGAGNDRLYGGQGNDLLAGGDGADTFVFENVSENDYDTITDFQAGIDHLAFYAADLGLSQVQQGVSLVTGQNAAATTVAPTLLYDRSTGILSFDADGTGDHAALQLAVLANRPLLGASDITLL